MKIAFFGTSDRSIPILESIKQRGLVLCITKRDVTVGRHKEMKESGVKKWAKENSIPYLEIDSLKNENLDKVLTEISNKGIDVGLVCDFSYIIPKVLIDKFNDNLFNIHFSLLPKYRGASPVQFAILNGDKHTGITYQTVGEKLDEGNILYQHKVEIDNTDTSGSLYNKMFVIAGEITPEFLDKVEEGLLVQVKQNDAEASYTYSKTNPKSTQVYKEDAKIDWSKSVLEIERMCRAYSPWPTAWTYIKDLENNSKIKETVRLKNNVKTEQKLKILEVVENNGLLEIKKLQPENKNKMDWESFKNGYIVLD